MTNTELTNTTEAGSPSGEPASGVCTKCGAPRDRKNSRYCKADRDSMAAEYRARARPRPTYEQRVCAFDGCDEAYTWCSMRGKHLYCSKSHYMKARHMATRAERVDVPEGTLLCSLCNKLKERSEFPPSTQNNKRTSWCRECNVKKERDWARANPERRAAATRRSRAARLLRKYQAPHDDVDLLLDQQGGVCYLCHGPAGTKGFHIDHDHELHEQGLPSYRGLACHGCNVGIGAMEDDPIRMVAIAQALAARKAELRPRQPHIGLAGEPCVYCGVLLDNATRGRFCSVARLPA